MRNGRSNLTKATTILESIFTGLAIASIIVFAFSSPSFGQEKQTVAVLLIPPNGDTCVGSPFVSAEAVFTNLTGRTIETSPDGLQSNLMFTAYKDGKPVDGGGGISEITPQTWIKLQPHQSLVVPFRVSIKGRPRLSRLFDAPGFVGLQIGFGNYLRDAGRGGQFAGSVKTNKVFLLVADCAGRAP